jgi:hypothetical protein
MKPRLPTYVRRDVFTPPWPLAGAFAVLRASLAPRRFGQMHMALARVFALAPGARDNYFHFLVGYLLPLVHAQSRRRFSPFLALDCGPLMTPILVETLRRLGHDARIVAADAVETPVFVEPWDKVDLPLRSPRALVAAVAAVREAWRDHACPGTGCATAEHVLVARAPAPAVPSGNASLFGIRYGAQTRGITNLDEVTDRLRRAGVPHCVYEPGSHSLGCQIAAFGNARRMLGIRGADWANLVWSRPGVRVRMLDPHPPAKTLEGFMRRLGVRHEFARVANRHAAEDPGEALRFFTEP